jgi:DNA-binding response OmpR family regulator
VSAQLLLVEDDMKIGKGVAQALENSGYEITWVTTGRAALDAAISQPPALVLLDLGLPDVDGVEVCAQLRAAVPSATIVILTARTDEIDVVVGLDAGADDYVGKPFRLGELLARVRAPEGVRPSRAAGRERRPRHVAGADHGGGVGRALVRIDEDARHAHQRSAPEAGGARR